MTMDTTFQSPNLMWRAVSNEAIQLAAYLAIIVWQVLAAMLLWLGVIRLVRARHADRAAFAKAKDPAILGLTAGFLLYGFGFLGIAGEWFAMWQSEHWNGQAKAGMFLGFIGIALLHLCGPEED
jgi:predicted small integral membrane protein